VPAGRPSGRPDWSLRPRVDAARLALDEEQHVVAARRALDLTPQNVHLMAQHEQPMSLTSTRRLRSSNFSSATNARWTNDKTIARPLSVGHDQAARQITVLAPFTRPIRPRRAPGCGGGASAGCGWAAIRRHSERTALPSSANMRCRPVPECGTDLIVWDLAGRTKSQTLSKPRQTAGMRAAQQLARAVDSQAFRDRASPADDSPKIVVSPVRVRVSPSGEAPANGVLLSWRLPPPFERQRATRLREVLKRSPKPRRDVGGNC
jgi:hypothetical protein